MVPSEHSNCLLLKILSLIGGVFDVQKGNSLTGEYHDMMFLTTPMVHISLVAGEDGVQFSPPLEKTKEIMINCLKEIVENTQQFPRIEKEIFPEYAESDLFLLDVTWKEDYIQELGQYLISHLNTLCFSAPVHCEAQLAVCRLTVQHFIVKVRKLFKQLLAENVSRKKSNPA